MSIKDIALQLALKFLKDNSYTESFLNLEIQSKTNLQEYPKQIEFLKKILLKGHFNEAVQFIWTFEQKIPNKTLKKLTLEIYKQKLYELLENPNENQLKNLFEKEIINVCTEDQYQNLFTLLTCRSVKELPGMDIWSSIKGRYSCFQLIQPHLQSFFDMTHYHKTNEKIPSFCMEETIESYLLGIEKIPQRADKLQKGPSQSKHFIADKQSKQSIQSKSSKYDRQPPPKQQKFGYKNEKSAQMEQQQQKKSLLNLSQYKNKQNPNNKSQTFIQPNKKHQIQQLQMSESKIEKSQLSEKYDKTNNDQQNQYPQNNNIFNKKYNPYIADTSLSNNYNLSKNQSKHINYSVHPSQNHSADEDERIVTSSYKQIKEKYSNKDKQIELEKKSQNYFREIEKEGNDSDDFQEEVRKNIAYLDQNNSSMVYKQDENQNFTFSIGAEDSANNEKNRRILKLTSFSDPKAIRTCQFSPSGTLFALGTNSSYLKIYDIEQLIQTNQPKQLQSICSIQQLHTKSIFCLDWSSNDKSIVTCSNDLTIKITQFVDGVNSNNYRTNVIGRHQSCIRMVKFNSLENKVVSCGDDSLLKVWDIGKIKKCTSLKGHTQSISAFKFADNEQDNIIYSVSKDCTIKKWDLRVGQCITASAVQESQLTFIASHTNRIAVSHKNGCVSFFNESLQMQHAVQIHEQQIRSIDGTHYDDLLLTASFDGNISLFTQKCSESPNYHQHNENEEDKVVFATFLNHPQHRGFASTSTLGICNIFSYE